MDSHPGRCLLVMMTKNINVRDTFLGKQACGDYGITGLDEVDLVSFSNVDDYSEFNSLAPMPNNDITFFLLNIRS